MVNCKLPLREQPDTAWQRAVDDIDNLLQALDIALSDARAWNRRVLKEIEDHGKDNSEHARRDAESKRLLRDCREAYAKRERKLDKARTLLKNNVSRAELSDAAKDRWDDVMKD